MVEYYEVRRRIMGNVEIVALIPVTTYEPEPCDISVRYVGWLNPRLFEAN